MENHVNVGGQNTQQIVQNPINYWKVITIFFVILFFGSLGWYFLLSPQAPQENGKNIKYKQFTCREFADKHKNYVVGDVIVGFKPGATFQEAKDIIQTLGVSISADDPIARGEIKVVDGVIFWLKVSVPPQQEKSFVEKFSKNDSVEFAELNGCNTGAGPL